ncbi:CopD family protein [Paenibacillus sp. HB172176]|uniref:copper resistance D family protein n=1 Tax=Paenibacillus sp. HB172176 TaxID=2493690 RepID=UPI00143B6D99|nr:CopD family protein [Paenibacillus sp. HB172176]
MYIYFFEAFLYLAFSFTAGYIALLFISEDAKPVMGLPATLFPYVLLSIPLFSFGSILNTTIILQDYAKQYSFLKVLFIVLSDYSFGHAWIWTLVLATVFFIISASVASPPGWFKWLYVLLWMLMLLANGWASHPSSLSKFLGALSQIIHVGAVSVWLGVLIIVAWFADRNDEKNQKYERFLKWYTPLSIVCMSLIIIAGISMMIIIVDGYLQSWTINYGEALLLKHILLIPILILAFMNGFRSKISKEKRWTWLRMETIFAFSILLITGFMGVQEPPHAEEYESPVYSKLYMLLNSHYNGDPVNWGWSFTSLVGIVLGIVFFVVVCIKRKKFNPLHFVLFCLSGTALLFLGLLLAVV